MKLRTRLFLFVGCLLLLTCVAIFLVPVYVAEQQGEEDRKAYLARLDLTQEELWQKTYNWILSEMGEIEGAIDASLYLVDSSPHVAKVLQNPRGVWLPAAQLLGYTARGDFVQLTQDKELRACTFLTNYDHYWVFEEPIDDQLAWVTFSTRRWLDPYTWATAWIVPTEVEQHTYLGVKLPPLAAIDQQRIAFQEEEKGSPLRLLFDYEYLYSHPEIYKSLLQENKEALRGLSLEGIFQAGELMENFLNEVIAAQDYLQKNFSDTAALDTFVTQHEKKVKTIKTEFSLEAGIAVARPTEEMSPLKKLARDRLISYFVWQKMRRRVLDMVQGMSLFASMGVVWETPLEASSPIAAAYVATGSQQGGGIYAAEVFSSRSLFDAEALLKTHPPKKESVPISTGFGLVPVDLTGDNTVVNALELPDNGSLSLGVGLLRLVRELEAVTGYTLVLIYDNTIPIQNRPKEDPSGKFFENLPGMLSQVTGKHGFITIAGKKYHYMRFQPNPEWDLAFASFAPAEDVEEPYQVFEKRSDILLRKIILWILVVAIVVLALALVVLHFIARHFTAPITKLAEATHHIVDGRYDDVDLPRVTETSRDEVSVLTNAFGKMVKGLIDRTKIRAVLDKVVSKEIAEEILNGAVELGGEVRTATVLFADMGRLTPQVAKLSPEKEVGFINHYLNEMTSAIEGHWGVIDKYVGDSIMALYGAPVFHEYAALQSVISALLMIEKLDKSINIGIGINTGEMVAGNVGAEERLNYTVIGANVNLAARISKEAKAREILIPKSMAEIPQIKQYIDVETYSTISFKGFTEPVAICRVVGVKAPHTLESLSQMVSHA